MPRLPIFRLGGAPEKPELPNLAASTPFVSLEGLNVGVDNLRHDVVLSPKFSELGRAQIARSIARHGELDGNSASALCHCQLADCDGVGAPLGCHRILAARAAADSAPL